MDADAALPAAPAEVLSLPALVARAAQTLANAKTAAEVLDAGEMASFAYDIAKRQARFAKAKRAHDDLVAAAHRAQADALEIEAQAKRRLADEYDAAQERGEVAKGSVRTDIVPSGNDVRPATAADLGLSRTDIHEARIIRDAEAAHPGIVRQSLDAKLAAGEEPTRAAVKADIRAVLEGEGRVFSSERTRKVVTNRWKHFGDVVEISVLASCQSASAVDIPAGMPDEVYEEALIKLAAARRHIEAFARRVRGARRDANARADAALPLRPAAGGTTVR